MYQVSRPPSASDANLLDRAVELIGMRGLRGVATRAIAEHAGVSPALVNYRFGSRAGLIDAALERASAADAEAWQQRRMRIENLNLAASDIRSLLHGLVREDFVAGRRAALSRWASIVETERTGDHAAMSWRWMSSPARFWEFTLGKLGLDAELAPILAATLLSSGLPYLFANPSFEHEAWVHDLVDRVADRLLGLKPATRGDSPWRQLAERAAEEHLASHPPRDDAGHAVRTIIDGAVAIVMSDGVDALTHRAVAERAGVSLSSTTHHFASLDEILIAACIEVYRRARASALDPSGAVRPFTLEQMTETLTSEPGPEANLRAEMATIHEVMIAISRTPAVRPIAVGLLAQTGRTSTAALAAMRGKRDDTDRIDGQIFAHAMTGYFLLTTSAPSELRSKHLDALAAFMNAVWC